MRTLIIEEQANELAALQLLLQENFSYVKVIGTASNGQEGLETIAKHRPELVLLCMHLPDAAAMELLQLLGSGKFALICMVRPPVQLPQFLELAALLCLRTPVDTTTMAICLFLAKKHLYEQQVPQPLVRGLNQWQYALYSNIALPMENELLLYRAIDILYCEADKNYTYFYLTGERKETVSKGLSFFAEQLEKLGFIKVGRSIMVNVYHVSSFYFKYRIHELVLNGTIRVHVPRDCVNRVVQQLEALTGMKWK